MTTSFTQYLDESWSLDQMNQAVSEFMTLFRFTANLGWGEQGTDMEDRLVVFAGEIDPQLIQNHLIATGWEFVEADADEADSPDGKFEGYIRANCDVMVRRGNMLVTGGANMPGHYLGVYCDQDTPLDDQAPLDDENETSDVPAESLKTDEQETAEGLFGKSKAAKLAERDEHEKNFRQPNDAEYKAASAHADKNSVKVNSMHVHRKTGHVHIEGDKGNMISAKNPKGNQKSTPVKYTFDHKANKAHGLHESEDFGPEIREAWDKSIHNKNVHMHSKSKLIQIKSSAGEHVLIHKGQEHSKHAKLSHAMAAGNELYNKV